MPEHRHMWDFVNTAAMQRALDGRNAAFRRARLGRVMATEGMDTALAVHDRIMAEHPIPTPGPIMCHTCGALREGP